MNKQHIAELEKALADLEVAKLAVAEATRKAFPVGSRVYFSYGYMPRGPGQTLVHRLHEAEVLGHSNWIGNPAGIGVRNLKTGATRRVDMSYELRFNK